MNFRHSIWLSITELKSTNLKHDILNFNVQDVQDATRKEQKEFPLQICLKMEWVAGSKSKLSKIQDTLYFGNDSYNVLHKRGDTIPLFA